MEKDLKTTYIYKVKNKIGQQRIVLIILNYRDARTAKVQKMTKDKKGNKNPSSDVSKINWLVFIDIFMEQLIICYFSVYFEDNLKNSKSVVVEYRVDLI